MIYVFAPDADGCLFHQAYRKSIIQDVVAHNHELLNFVAQQVGGKGGGKPEMAMAGGNDPSKIGAALAGVKDWIASK